MDIILSAHTNQIFRCILLQFSIRCELETLSLVKTNRICILLDGPQKVSLLLLQRKLYQPVANFLSLKEIIDIQFNNFFLFNMGSSLLRFHHPKPR